MSLLLFLDRIKNKLLRTYRKAVFRKKIGCPHKNFTLVETVDVTNRRITLGKGVILFPGVSFGGDGEIKIGDNVNIGKDTILYASRGGGITIGDNTQIAAQCYLIDADHGTKKDTLVSEQPLSVLPIALGKDVWLGAGVKVLKGSTIGNGAIVGAQSVVKGEIPENAIAVGAPAKIKKSRE